MAAPVVMTLRVADRATRSGSPGAWWFMRGVRESKHLALIRRTIGKSAIHAHAEGIGFCLALTDQELLVGRARWFGSHIERYRLNRLLRLHRLVNRTVDLLELEFAGLPPTRVVSMYDVRERTSFAAIISRLQRRLAPQRPFRERIISRRRDGRARVDRSYLRVV